MAAAPAFPYESDVHFGLTYWLALRAGFDASESTAIALGNQRVDAGTMETLVMSFEYACTSIDAETARDVQRLHFPSSRSVPADIAERGVEPGGAASRQALQILHDALPGREGLMLGQFGKALHPLQDSFAHAGGGQPDPMPLRIPCDQGLLWPGGASHEHELTSKDAPPVVDMAKATFDALTSYPAIKGRPRRSQPWSALAPEIEAFARSTSKSSKRLWFNRHGLTETSFLAGISLPDGPDPGMLGWDGAKLPALVSGRSLQHDVPIDAREFVDTLLALWLAGEPARVLLREYGPEHASSGRRNELALLMDLWRWPDHGSAAAFLHRTGPLTGEAARRAAALVRKADPNRAVRTSLLALFPLQPNAPPSAPLVPYVLRSLTQVDQPDRMLVMLRLRHAPYDTLAWVIEKRESAWRLADIAARVEP